MNTQGNKQHIVLFIFGIFIICLLISISIFFPSVIHDYFDLYKVILAIACAGIASMIPGFFNIRYKNLIRAGGALGVFTFIVLFVSPNRNFFAVRAIVSREDNEAINEKGKLTMFLGSEPRVADLQNENDALFENIPIKYSNSPVKFKVSFSEKLVLSHPDSSYILDPSKIIFLKVKLKLNSTVSGTVLFNDSPIADVLVSIGELTDTTDVRGYYSIQLNPEGLNDEQIVNLYKPGYKFNRQKIHLQTLKILDVVLEK